MGWFAVVLLMGLVFTVTDVASISVAFINADGNEDVEFNEGDMVTFRCRADYTDTPFTLAKIDWQRHGSEVRLQITDDNTGQIVQQYQDRFSGGNLTNIGDNTVDYRFTISNVDRYENGYSFYCEFTDAASGTSTGAGGVARKMIVNWIPPSAQCLDIADKVKKGDTVSYQCSAVDVDMESSGSISVLKNGNELETVPQTSPATPTGTRYNVTYTTPLTDAKDEYTCRYSGTGGYEDYNAECAFNEPSCVADDLAVSCPVGGAVSSRDHVQIITLVGLPTLIMLWMAVSD